MNKHTPGPWQVVVHNFMLWSVECADGIVGEVTFSEYDDDQDVDSRMRANARLIASAPDLLESLINLIELTSNHYDSEIYEAARAAIAKATGESA